MLGDALMQDVSPDVQMEAALGLMGLGVSGSGKACLKRSLERTDLRPVLRTLINEALTQPTVSPTNQPEARELLA